MNRPLIQVACGVLVQADGRVLIAQRPPGKLAAGKWEFPGGKIESGELPLEALTRELQEELGITITDARPLLKFRHDYSDRCVVLDTWRVSGWHGEPESREGQAFAWMHADQLMTLDVLPTVTPIVRALRLPANYVFTPPLASLEFLVAGLTRLPEHALLRLRQPTLVDSAYEARAVALLEACRATGIRLMLDRDPEQVSRLGAAGWHATSAALARHAVRPLPETFIVAASIHDLPQREAARRLDADCAVLGPVQATPTHPDVGGIGWHGFRAIRGEAGLAVYALGGLGPRDRAVAERAGAQGVAGISAYW